jgi:hypothetical protein
MCLLNHNLNNKEQNALNEKKKKHISAIFGTTTNYLVTTATWHPGSVQPCPINLRFRMTVSTMAHIPSTEIDWCYILLFDTNTCYIYN